MITHTFRTFYLTLAGALVAAGVSALLLIIPGSQAPGLLRAAPVVACTCGAALLFLSGMSAVAVLRRSEQEAGFLRQSANQLESTIRDLQHQRDTLIRQHRELEDKSRALETANHDLVSFSGSLVHELASPLTTVLGFTQVLLEDSRHQPDPETADILNRISEGARTMQHHLESIKSLSMLQKIPLQPMPVDLTGLCGTLCSEVAQEYPQVAVDWHIQPGMQAVTDPQMLRIILGSLTDNAIKFRRTDAPRIEIGSTSDNGKSLFYVKDDGIGFEPDQAEQIFVAFKRLLPKTSHPGDGLGLTRCKRAIVRLGGDIFARSAPGEGSTFFFRV